MLAFRRGNPHASSGGMSALAPKGHPACFSAYLHGRSICDTLHIMRLTAPIQLLPTPEQADALRRTLETANAACDYISQVAWESEMFRQFSIHRLTYQAVRETFNLAAQLV